MPAFKPGDHVRVRIDVDLPHPQTLGQGKTGIVWDVINVSDNFTTRDCYIVSIDDLAGYEIRYYEEELEKI
jgi:ribosomal protein L21E